MGRYHASTANRLLWGGTAGLACLIVVSYLLRLFVWLLTGWGTG